MPRHSQKPSAGSRFVDRDLEAERARFRALKEARRRRRLLRIEPSNSRGSATLSHLSTPFVDKKMRPRRGLHHGARVRFLTPTPEPTAPADDQPRRQISAQQVKQYRRLRQDVIALEQRLAKTHHAFFHAQDPRLRVAQDLYKRVFERHHGLRLPKDFHFLRFPGPRDKDYRKFRNVRQFFETDMAAHGMIDDNITPTKSHIISANVALHGSLGHAGEETFHYFQIGKGQTEIPVARFMADFLDKFGLESQGAERFYQAASRFNDTKEGSLFQIMVPKKHVDQVAYMAHPHGLPHDDQLLEDLHRVSPIRYSSLRQGAPQRESMNEEVTRNLEAMRTAHQSRAVVPRPVRIPRGTLSKAQVARLRPALRQSAEQQKLMRLQQLTAALNQRTVARFRRGDFRPSRVLRDFVHAPGKLQHPQGPAQRVRIENNPEHFSGQGMRSRHEVMRIQNRSNFLQARMLLSESHMLNPASGIRIRRHTTQSPEDVERYEQLLDAYVDHLFRRKAKTRRAKGPRIRSRL